MRLLESLCCFILFFAEIGDPLGRPSGQRLQGVTGGGSHRAAAQESFLFAVPLWAPRGFVECLYVYWFLFLLFFFNFFFLAKANNGSHAKNSPSSRNGGKP